ncbi:type II toxin-antitoxin system HipA family toxin [Azohydromonas lata]|uniref:HipA domain-containing protein n=1 Tax=Azohydromonas lata TaxID=45677 RepID=A0ABU5IK19_9BURK|nr:HipA domain-containing protein [Azohydromonas lata]MDZ5459248.1 HipA domain-containing protein [Azohydromonas lata]
MTRRAPVYRWIFDEAAGQREAIRVGELTQEASRWEFRYDRAYLQLGPKAWELDPTGIRTKQSSTYTQVGVLPHPVFCEVAVSGWALEALKQRGRVKVPMAEGDEPWGWWERLVHAPADGFGALFVGEPDSKVALDAMLRAELRETARHTVAYGRESSSGVMGGERPKLPLYLPSIDGEVPEEAVLLKFAMSNERSDSVVAEASALSLGDALGLTVPAHRVSWYADKPALRIERFDRGPGIQGKVFHCVSAATALGLHPGTLPEDPRRSYVHLRSKLRRPGDGLELYKRIVLNAVVGNTDDHPWNTSLRQQGLGDWELSPLYDVMPFFNRSGRPVFRMAITNRNERTGSVANLISAARALAGLKQDEALQIIEHTTSFVRQNWRETFEMHAQGHLSPSTVQEWKRVFEYEWGASS